jgi:hypothetical protein
VRDDRMMEQPIDRGDVVSTMIGLMDAKLDRVLAILEDEDEAAEGEADA